MVKTYIIILSDTLIDRDEIITYLKSKLNISYWEYCLPSAIFLQSQNSAKEISDALEGKLGDKRRLVIEAPDSNFWGILPKGYWKIFGVDS